MEKIAGWALEPWIYDSGDGLIYEAFTPDRQECCPIEISHKPNARRIVACVNACAGMVDPAAEIAKLRAEREELQRRIDNFRDEFLEKALEWRGISFVDEACDGCGGSGVVAYGSTATWHGGIGGQAITNGVCDKCWGSGNRLHKWADLRKLHAALAEKEE